MRSRAYDGPADVRRMQRLVQDAWCAGGTKTAHHVGDVAWAHAQLEGTGDASERRLWLEGERVAAWGWFHPPATLDWQLDPALPQLLDEVLDWFEERAEARPLLTSALAEDGDAVERLGARGYVRTGDDEPWFAYLRRELDDVAAPGAPAGFTLRSVTAADEERRVAVHRAAWEPSRFTAAGYRAVRATWPYRDDLDCVAESGNGEFASYALAWYDDENRVGELEPVGTAPSYRRRGVARAVNVFALHRLREAGAETAVVMCRGDAAYPVPKLLYESVGFRQHTRALRFTRA